MIWGYHYFWKHPYQVDDLQKGHAPGKTLSVDWAYERFLHRGIFPTTVLATCRLHPTSTLHWCGCVSKLSKLCQCRGSLILKNTHLQFNLWRILDINIVSMDWRLVPLWIKGIFRTRAISTSIEALLQWSLLTWNQNHWQCYTRCQKRLPVWWGSKHSCNKLNPQKSDRSKVETVRPKFFFESFNSFADLKSLQKHVFLLRCSPFFFPNLYHFDFIISPSTEVMTYMTSMTSGFPYQKCWTLRHLWALRTLRPWQVLTLAARPGAVDWHGHPWSCRPWWELSEAPDVAGLAIKSNPTNKKSYPALRGL